VVEEEDQHEVKVEVEVVEVVEEVEVEEDTKE